MRERSLSNFDPIASEFTSPIIAATLVLQKQRLSFFPKHFGSQMLRAEDCIFQYMEYLCESYQGGYWHFYTLSNGGIYIAPALSEPLKICVAGNYYSGMLSADAAGIVACLFAIYHLAILDKSKSMTTKYYLLKDYAGQHVEASKIYAAID